MITFANNADCNQYSLETLHEDGFILVCYVNADNEIIDLLAACEAIELARANANYVARNYPHKVAVFFPNGAIANEPWQLEKVVFTAMAQGVL